MRASKLLERMRANPRDDWRIDDVLTVCRAFDVDHRRVGSHVTLSHPRVRHILTVPAHKPIKTVYIIGLVQFMDTLLGPEA